MGNKLNLLVKYTITSLYYFKCRITFLILKYQYFYWYRIFKYTKKVYKAYWYNPFFLLLEHKQIQPPPPTSPVFLIIMCFISLFLAPARPYPNLIPNPLGHHAWGLFSCKVLSQPIFITLRGKSNHNFT